MRGDFIRNLEVSSPCRITTNKDSEITGSLSQTQVPEQITSVKEQLYHTVLRDEVGESESWIEDMTVLHRKDEDTCRGNMGGWGADWGGKWE